MIRARTDAPEATRELASALAELSRAGDLIVLSGDLGAGKTAFTQGFGKALGIEGPITSPTFTLANEYEGRLLLNHLDVYRLEQLEEVLDLGLPELLEGDTVTVIEWGDAIAPALPANYLEITLTLGDETESDDTRYFSFRSVGPRWAARERAIGTALARFAVPAEEGSA